MNLNNVFICDLEATSLLDGLSSFDDFHVLSCAYKNKNGGWDIKSTNKKEDVEKLVGNPNNTLVFHNGISYDKPALEIMGVEFKAEIIDTLALSYYLYNELDNHGLESWGERFGVKKPEIEDWTGLTYEEYKFRCQEDVKINTNLWVMMLEYLRNLYDSDEGIIRTIKYLNHKAHKLFTQDRNPILIDIEQCEKNIEYLQSIVNEKTEDLKKILPKIPNYSIKSKPKKIYKVDGTLTNLAKKWFDMLEELNLPEDYEGGVKVVTSYTECNPSSSTQIKQFLFSKGWKPKIFKDGANGKVPQLRNDDKELCDSITKLFSEYPELESLQGLSVAEHRLAYLKSFLKHSDENGYAKAWAHGYTRTLRLKHTAPFVNLPRPSSDYGELVRGVMVAPEGYVCIGADLSSIEDKCKQISIYNIDKPYVESMNSKGWDAHLALGLKAGMFTQDEVQFYKWWKNIKKEDNPYTCPESFQGLTDDEKDEAFHSLDKKRAVAKTSTYLLTYGGGVAKLMEATDLPKKEAAALHKSFHDLNWAVKRYADSRITKTVKGKNWLRLNKKAGGVQEVNELTWMWNEHTNLWLFLKNTKDIFSGCNQNFGVKVFDVWTWILLQEGITQSYESHDELLWYCKEEDVDKHIEILNRSVVKLNNVFKPPVPLEIDYKVGKTYASVH